MDPLRAVVLASFAGVAFAACGTSSTDIADLSVVTTLPKEVGPGGFEQQIGVDGVATGVFFKAALSDCGPEIDRVARAWAGQYGLTQRQRRLDEGNADLQFTSERFPDGVFVISYTLAPGTSARVHVAYEGGSAGNRSATDFELLGIVTLIDDLLTAARCDSTGQELSKAIASIPPTG